MEEPVRRQIAVRALRDRWILLDLWDRAVEQVQRNRDHLVQVWERIEARWSLEPPGREASELSLEHYSEVAITDYDNLVFELTPTARGLLVDADEAERLGDEVTAALEIALRKATCGLFTPLTRKPAITDASSSPEVSGAPEPVLLTDVADLDGA